MAFKRLAKLIIDHYSAIEKPKREISNEVIRVYHGVRNEVIDKASGKRSSFKDVVIQGDVESLIKARKTSLKNQS